MKIKFQNIKDFKDLKKVKLESYKDKRGLFSRIYCKKELKKINFAIKQINLSVNTKKGTLRGLHYMSKPSKEKKIVFCIKGAIFDVVIDLRKNSKTYLKKKYFYLDEKKKFGIYIPDGFAHGFQTLKNGSEVIYLHSEYYKKKFDSGVNPLDKKINIKWPLKSKIISKKDLNLPKIK